MDEREAAEHLRQLRKMARDAKAHTAAVAAARDDELAQLDVWKRARMLLTAVDAGMNPEAVVAEIGLDAELLGVLRVLERDLDGPEAPAD